MTDELRDKVARFEFNHILDSGFPSHSGIPFEELPDDWWSKAQAYKRADQILQAVIECVEGIGVENHYAKEISELVQIIINLETENNKAELHEAHETYKNLSSLSSGFVMGRIATKEAIKNAVRGKE